ncbi:hypothetical protein NSERKGN1266_45310 [Nocardia seriolae]|nr:hypothetical protein NSERUTF1_3678 [Nocardia seriolae]BEK88580.1 hypothetical protein NSERKGN1266_45310 [Nocardia seriolae]BEK96332.1 hypothetical protein NSER024013_42380 [Nocardia seriolae]
MRSAPYRGFIPFIGQVETSPLGEWESALVGRFGIDKVDPDRVAGIVREFFSRS